MSDVHDPGVSPGEMPLPAHPIEAVPTSNTGFIGAATGGPLNQAVRVTSYGDYEAVFGRFGPDSPMSYAVLQYFDHGGKNAYVVRVAKKNPGKKGSNRTIGFREIRQGLKAFDSVDFLNLLCVPPFRFQHDVDLQTWKAALDYCAARRAFLIVDAPSTWETRQDVRDLPRSRNAAMFFPRLVINYPLTTSTPGVFAPCGAVAGLFARTDTERGVWKAPAGPDAILRGVLGVSASPSEAEVDELSRLGINCIRHSPAHGIVIWGAQTLQESDPLASEWKYIPVRRTALFIEESLYQGLEWTVFEPNDEPLWTQIRLNVGAFLQNLFQQGALQGQTPREAYFVKCDRETNSPADIEQGNLNILVGFAPLRPAEFVIVRIGQKTLESRGRGA